MSKYLLHVNVKNAEGLLYEGQPAENCHPFVRLHIHERNKYYKSEDKEGADPEWEEEIQLEVIDPTSDSLIVEVVSVDVNKELLLCDPCMIDLDNLELEDDESEVDLELQKDGQPCGTLHLGLTLGENEEAPTEFSGPVLVRVEINDASGVTELEKDEVSLDTYLDFLLKGHDPKETIKSIINKTSSDPADNQSFSFISNDPANDIITMKLVSGNRVIIENEEQKISELEPYTKSKTTLQFETGDETGGTVSIEFCTYDLSQISNTPVKLHLKVSNAQGLKNLDADKSDPYVKASVGEQEFTTEVQKNTLDPVWNQEFDFESKDPLNDKLTLKLLDKDVAVDDKMMDDLVFPVRDIKVSETKEPIVYNVPLRLKGKQAGLLSFEVLAQGECLRIHSPSKNIVVEFTVLKADFEKCKDVKISYGVKSREEDPPEDIDLNNKISVKCRHPENDAIILIFSDQDDENLCDPVSVDLSQFGINGESDFISEVKLDDQKTGDVHVQFYIKDPSKPIPQPEPVAVERAVTLVQDDYCEFLWGTYGSSYSTSFTGYSNCDPLSSTISDAEMKYHHRHPVLDQDTTKPKRRSETFSGNVSTIELDAPNTLVVGDSYYATATLYGKSSRNSSKFPAIQSETVEAKDANKISFEKLGFNFDTKVKKGDYIDVYLYHQKDNKQIAKSTIVLEKVDPSEQENAASFPLNEYKLVKNPAKIGTLNANLKHTVDYQ